MKNLIPAIAIRVAATITVSAQDKKVFFVLSASDTFELNYGIEIPIFSNDSWQQDKV